MKLYAQTEEEVLYPAAILVGEYLKSRDRRLMAGKIYHYLAGDHARLDLLLAEAASDPKTIDPAAYAEFRAGLLRHIALEEKILLPAAQRLRDGKALPIAAKLRLDHGALAALLVPTPTASIVAAIRSVLEAHNPLEEGPAGLYEECERLAGAEADPIVEALRNAPEVRVAPHNDGPGVIEATRRALAKAGYSFEL
ncbi:MAG TPA: hemerythrin domain-containing protein [Candidatus Eisenbacteria bacterium]|nr:hemerythrin domain-containing protein [Candidatus Eisenbacteria bacterium]